MANLPWYREAFGEAYLRFALVMLPPEQAAREVEAVVRLLALPPGSSLLDLCCGHGRHAIPLARRGYRVTGLDLSQDLLRRAREEAGTLGVQVRWVHADMREIPFEAEFDAIINLYVAFGYLEDDGEDERVLRRVCKALKPGGLFVQELASREAVVRHFVPQVLQKCMPSTKKIQLFVAIRI